MLPFLNALLYYAFILFGSVSIGYLVLRLGYAEIRTWSAEQRLGASALLGVLITLVAIAIDAAISGVGSVALARGWLPPIFLGTFSLAFLILRLASTRVKRFVDVAIPYERGG